MLSAMVLVSSTRSIERLMIKLIRMLKIQNKSDSLVGSAFASELKSLFACKELRKIEPESKAFSLAV